MSTDSIEKTGIKDRTNALEKSEENNDSNNGLQAVTGPDGQTVYVAYRERWLVLLNLSILIAGCFLVQYAFGPISIYISPWVIYIPGLWVAIYVIGKYELLIATRFAATLCSIGSLIRILGTFPPWRDDIDRQTQYWITFAGQVVLSFGYPILFPMCTKTSQVWFPEAERPLSTAVLSLASIFGGVFGQALGPIIVNKNPLNVPYINIAFSVPIFVGTIITWTCIRRGKPRTPPSRSAAMLADKKPPSVKEMLMDIKVLATGKTTHVLAACIGAGMGMTNTLMSQLNQMMCSRNYSVAQSSVAAILNVLIGLVGGFTLGPLARKHGLQVEFGKCGTVITCAFMIALAMCLREYNVYPAIVLFLSMYGLFGIAAYPMNLELMTETTYPMDPIMGECWVHTHAQIASILLVVLGNNMYWDLPPNAPQQCSELDTPDGTGVEARDYTPYYYFLEVTSAIVAMCFIFLINPKLHRTTEDHVADGIEARKHEGSVSGRSTTTPEIIFNTEKEQSSSDSE